MPSKTRRLTQIARVQNERKRLRVSAVNVLERRLGGLKAEREDMAELLVRTEPGDIALARLAVRRLASIASQLRLNEEQLTDAKRALIETAIDHHAAQRIVEMRRTEDEKKKAVAAVEDAVSTSLSIARSSQEQGSS